jgi:hypothetical protein
LDFDNGTQDYAFDEKLLILDQRLSTCSTLLTGQLYFKYLFQGFCQYYLQKPSYMKYLEMAADTGLFPEFLPHIIPLVNEQRTSERILIMVSFSDALNFHFKQLCNIHYGITVIVADDDFEPNGMLESWGAYDQVFIAGHGEDKSDHYEGHIRLGKKILTPAMITKAVSGYARHPSVLGIFTCGEAFYSMETRSQFDFFITDHQSSVARFIEMFLYGYLLTYFQSFNVLHAFRAGRLATIFMAKSDPTYKIFTRGVKLQE